MPHGGWPPRSIRASGPVGWLDLEVARRRAVAANGSLAHNAALYRSPLTTLDDHLARGLRVESLRELLEGFEAREDDDPAVLPGRRTRLRAAGAAAAVHPGLLRLRGARPGDVGAPQRAGPGALVHACRSSTSPTPRRSAGTTTRSGRRAAVGELDYELEVAAIIDTPAIDLPAERAEEAIGGFTIFDDWSARDLQREEMALQLGPAKGKDFASAFGPYLVTPDELADVRSGTGYDLAMTVAVNGVETGRARWSDAHFSFGEMLARASADVHLRPGEIVGSGTVGTGCLLETKEATLGRYLEPGDVVTLAIERLGELRNSIVPHPDAPHPAGRAPDSA